MTNCQPLLVAPAPLTQFHGLAPKRRGPRKPTERNGHELQRPTHRPQEETGPLAGAARVRTRRLEADSVEMGARAVVPRLPAARPAIGLLRDRPGRARAGNRRGRCARPQRVRQADLLNLRGREAGQGGGASGLAGFPRCRGCRPGALRPGRDLWGCLRAASSQGSRVEGRA